MSEIGIFRQLLPGCRPRGTLCSHDSGCKTAEHTSRYSSFFGSSSSWSFHWLVRRRRKLRLQCACRRVRSESRRRTMCSRFAYGPQLYRRANPTRKYSKSRGHLASIRASPCFLLARISKSFWAGTQRGWRSTRTIPEEHRSVSSPHSCTSAEWPPASQKALWLEVGSISVMGIFRQLAQCDIRLNSQMR
jgi:hypothetical protein